MKDPVNIVWLRDAKRTPVACAAFTEVTPGMVRYAVSVFNPHDKFNRKRGREIAIGRLTKSRKDLVNVVRTVGIRNDQAVLLEIAAEHEINRVREAAKLTYSTFVAAEQNNQIPQVEGSASA